MQEAIPNMSFLEPSKALAKLFGTSILVFPANAPKPAKLIRSKMTILNTPATLQVEISVSVCDALMKYTGTDATHFKNLKPHFNNDPWMNKAEIRTATPIPLDAHSLSMIPPARKKYRPAV